MRKLVFALVLLGAVIASFGVLKIAQGLEPSGDALFSSAVNLEKGQATVVSFVPDESGTYDGPCVALCEGGKTGTLLFSSIR